MLFIVRITAPSALGAVRVLLINVEPVMFNDPRLYIAPAEFEPVAALFRNLTPFVMSIPAEYMAPAVFGILLLPFCKHTLCNSSEYFSIDALNIILDELPSIIQSFTPVPIILTELFTSIPFSLYVPFARLIVPSNATWLIAWLIVLNGCVLFPKLLSLPFGLTYTSSCLVIVRFAYVVAFR